jgi:hypothetical protein
VAAALVVEQVLQQATVSEAHQAAARQTVTT